MRRRRPPQPESKPYITPQGFERLKNEEVDIWKKRLEVTKALSAAAAEGDRSENAEYIYRKKQLAEIDRRIFYLQKRLPKLKVVTDIGDSNKIFFGASVELERGDGVQVKYRIVGADEIDADTTKGYISIDSPMACAMLQKKVDDEIVVNLDGHSQTFYVISISYD